MTTTSWPGCVQAQAGSTRSAAGLVAAYIDQIGVWTWPGWVLGSRFDRREG